MKHRTDWHHRRPHLVAVATIATCLLVLAACSSDKSSSTTTASSSSTTTTTPRNSGPRNPQPTPAKTIEALLGAEQKGDHAASFALLSDSARRAYKDETDWENRRTELPAITGFKIEKTTGDQVNALVEHKPGLDPFIGLSAAKEHQTWQTEKADGGYLSDAEPDVVYVLPSDSAAKSTAATWVSAVQACDQKSAMSMEALPELFGKSLKSSTICKASGKVSAGAVGNLDAGPESADIVAQYSTDALVWARVVPVTVGDISVKVALAPIGDVWKVMGVFD